MKCTACRNPQSIDVLHKGSLSLHQCLKCKTVFLGEYSNEFLPELYAYYDRYANLDKEDVFDPITSTRCQDLLRWFSRFYTGREILDVGCGLGQFVEMANKSGWKAEGLELSKGAVDFARCHGLAVRDLDFFSEEIKPNSCDLVTLFEVIEHVPNPSEFIRRAGEVVRPGGLVYLTTPNFASIDRFLLGKHWELIHREHLTYFTPRTLRLMVKRTSCFEILHFETRNMSLAALRALGFGMIPRNTQTVGVHDDLESEFNVPLQMNNLRSHMETSPFLSLMKRIVNGLLNVAGLGVTMCMLLRYIPAENAGTNKKHFASEAFQPTI